MQCENGPAATRTILGWVISGPVTSQAEGQDSTNLITHVLRVRQTSGRRDDGKQLERRLRCFWDLDSLGILDKEEDVYDQFHQMVEFSDGRYSVCLPWKDPLMSLPTKYELCLKRLRSLVKRLRENPILFGQYNQVIRDQVDQGIVEVVPQPEELDGDQVHYLPHHAEIKHSSTTTKVRVVYDASAKIATGSSLNDALLIGPKFNQRILDILLRFRLFPTALVANLEKAFLMVGVNRQDQDVLRFFYGYKTGPRNHLKFKFSDSLEWYLV